MTIHDAADIRAAAVPAAHLEAASEETAMLERHNYRARTWRLTLGALGLFWVCALIALMR